MINLQNFYSVRLAAKKVQFLGNFDTRVVFKINEPDEQASQKTPKMQILLGGKICEQAGFKGGERVDILANPEKNQILLYLNESGWKLSPYGVTGEDHKAAHGTYCRASLSFSFGSRAGLPQRKYPSLTAVPNSNIRVVDTDTTEGTIKGLLIGWNFLPEFK